MRRKDREIKDIDKIIEVMRKCNVCRLALFDEVFPYIVPLNYGFVYNDVQITMYLHCAKNGKKIDLINKNNNVCFEMDTNHNLITGPVACDYTMEYESVIGNGEISIINDNSNKIEALKILMGNFTANQTLEFEEKIVNAVTVLKLTVNSISGKQLKVQ